MENVTTLRTAAAPAPVQTDAEWHRRKNKATPRGVAVLEKVYAALAKKTAELWSVKGPATGDPSSDVASRAQRLRCSNA